MRTRTLAAVLLTVSTSAGVAGEAGRYPEFTFKRVAPPAATAPKRITVQIDPAQQAAYIAGLPRPGDDPRPDPVRPAPGDRTPGNATTAFPWFWASVSPALAAASPARLDQALSGLSNGPNGPVVPAPRLQSLQEIASTHGQDILRATVGTRVSPALVLAVIGIESAGRQDAVSHKGATGLMQLMPATAARFGVSDSRRPAENIRGGVAYLDWLMKEFGGDPMMVLAGYNAGEGAVRQHGGVPPYRETRDYVPKVLAAWSVARGLCVTPPTLLTDGCVFRVVSAGL
jgi:hypothetical protein